jgi:hypothetical protein
LDRLELIEALKHLRERVLEEIDGLPESELRYRPSESDWSIKEVVGHLRDGAEEWGKRLYIVWSQTDPVFVPYDQDARVKERGYQDADLGPVIAELQELRLSTVDLLSHAVDWTRLGQWPGVGRRSLRQLVEALVEAEAAHIEQIRSLKAAQGISGRAS